VKTARDLIDIETGMKSKLTTLEKNLHLAIDEVLKGELVRFGGTVTQYLPKDEEFEISVVGDSVAVGLLRNGETHTALSGSTEARTIAAMAAALMDYRHAKEGDAAVLVIDDRMWDAGTLARTMGALEDSPCQVLIMSTIKPKGRQRSGWTYVEVGTDA
jgi:hypothetical protein